MNSEIAGIQADQVDELRRTVAELVRAGQAEHELAELRGRLLEEERRGRFWDRWLWVGVGLLGVAIAE